MISTNIIIIIELLLELYIAYILTVMHCESVKWMYLTIICIPLTEANYHILIIIPISLLIRLPIGMVKRYIL